jgi:glycosyltransferase involved in cell wall biosynthesis
VPSEPFALLTHQTIWGGGERFLVDAADALRQRNIAAYIDAPSSSAIASLRPDLIGRIHKLRPGHIIANEFHQLWRSQVSRPGIPHTFIIHGPWQTSRLRDLWVAGTRTRAFVVSGTVQAAVLRNGILTKTRVPILPIGADGEVFRPMEDDERACKRKELGLSTEQPLLLYVGRLQGIKRFDLFVKVLSRLGPSFQGMALTPQPTTSEESAMLADFRMAIDRARMNGVMLHGANVAEMLPLADLTISTSEYESLGISMLESLACGVPVITTATGGPTDFIRPENGLQLVTDDPDSIAAAILASRFVREVGYDQREDIRQTVADRGPDSVAKVLMEGVA